MNKMEAVFEEMKQAMMSDPMNQTYTEQGIAPLFMAHSQAKIVIVGQAPGIKAQNSQLYWNDPSGDRLRLWLGMSRDDFYGDHRLAQLPMDFYFPGKGKQGDLPPRKDFAPKWHPTLLEAMPDVELILLIGNYAQQYYLGDRRYRTLTETVRHYHEYFPDYFPLVHPSPLNIGWRKRNPWFEEDVVPVLQAHVRMVLD